MGNTASKNTRTLLKDIGKAVQTLERSLPHPLPLQSLKDRYLAAQIERDHTPSPIPSFNTTPEGKDGMDPTVAGTSTYDASFLQSVGDLGKQITLDPAIGLNLNSVALRQLSSRKQLFAQGEKEATDAKSGAQNGIRHTVSPLTMTSIVQEINDPRITTKAIADTYNVSETFVSQIGTRFKVASTILILDDKSDESEVGHATPISQTMATSAGHVDTDNTGSDEHDHMREKRKRISLDD